MCDLLLWELFSMPEPCGTARFGWRGGKAAREVGAWSVGEFTSQEDVIPSGNKVSYRRQLRSLQFPLGAQHLV